MEGNAASLRGPDILQPLSIKLFREEFSPVNIFLVYLH